MTNNPQPIINTSDDLLYMDVIEFFASATVTTTCPCCGNNNWQLHKDVLESGVHKVPSFMMIDVNGEPVMGGVNFPLLLAICGRCAYVRMHSREIIKNWVLGGKKPLVPVAAPSERGHPRVQ